MLDLAQALLPAVAHFRPARALAKFEMRGVFRVGVSGAQRVDFHGGDIIEVPERIAAELTDKIQPVDELGTVVARTVGILDVLSTAMPHEKLSIIDVERARLKALPPSDWVREDLKALDDLANGLKPKPPAPPRGDAKPAAAPVVNVKPDPLVTKVGG
mgnify:CR=1 FL=1